MNPKNSQKRDLVSIDDLSVDEILELFRHADKFREDLSEWTHVCKGRIMATLFFEPSTRTRLSFESAMLRLGGGVITTSDPASSSRAKGESLADTVRVVGGNYADILVVRHPEDGAARVAAQYAEVPVINGGDGAHEHPTQTLCDLYTLWKEKGGLEGLDVVLCGDLRYSRTVHSFAYALARFGANIVMLPYPGFEMPKYVIDRLKRVFGVQAQQAAIGELPGIANSEDSIAYLTSSRPHQLALFTKLTPQKVNQIDAIYMTRAQRERHLGEELTNYPRLSRDSLQSEMMRDARVMHPLPRTEELDYDLDNDPRSVYFRQAELGVPIRMALMAFLMGRIELTAPPSKWRSIAVGLSSPQNVLRCRNDRCVTHGEGVRYLVPDFHLMADDPPLLSCAYCGREITAHFVGNSTTQLYHRYDSPDVRRIKPENRTYFETDEQARLADFRPRGAN